MNTLTVTCWMCGTPFDAQSQRARFCSSSCRGKAHRKHPDTRPVAPPAPITPPTAKPATPTAAPPVAVGPIEHAAAAKLAPVPRLDAVTRATMLGIARRLDDPNTPGGAVATLNKELHRVFRELDIEPPEPSPVDEARLSAARKLAALAGSPS